MIFDIIAIVTSVAGAAASWFFAAKAKRATDFAQAYAVAVEKELQTVLKHSKAMEDIKDVVLNYTPAWAVDPTPPKPVTQAEIVDAAQEACVAAAGAAALRDKIAAEQARLIAALKESSKPYNGSPTRMTRKESIKEDL